MSPLRLLFLHIPKTGGISLYTALAKIASLQPAIRFHDASRETRDRYLAMDAEKLRKHRMISGHFSLALFLRQPIGDYQVITVLRSPVDRQLSAYFYMKTETKHPRNEAMKDVSLTAYLESLEERKLRNPQCAALTGAGTYEAARKAIDSGRLLAAPMDYLAEFCAELDRRWGIGRVNLKHENSTKFRLRVSEIHPDIIRRFAALAEDDEALYQYTKRKFEREVLGK